MRVATTRPWDLAAVTAVAVLTVIVVLFAPWPPVRITLGLLFVLFAPGYALAAALFPERAIQVIDSETRGPVTRGIGGLERIALSLGMSIAVVPLVGLGLNYTPWGIRPTPILLAIGLFTLTITGLAYWRRQRLPEAQRLRFRLASAGWSEYSLLDKVLAGGLAVSMVAAGGALTFAAMETDQYDEFTEFYLLGPEGKAEGYPTQLAPGESGRVVIGVTNHEATAREYRVEVRLIEGQLVTSDTGSEEFKPDGERAIEEFRVSLQTGQNIEENLTIQAPTNPGLYRLEFHLMEDDGEGSYRKLHLWMRVG